MRNSRQRKAERTLLALREYEAACNDRRRAESERIFKHKGAFIPHCAPTDQGRIQAIARVL